jgi:hypothetical protein
MGLLLQPSSVLIGIALAVGVLLLFLASTGRRGAR